MSIAIKSPKGFINGRASHRKLSVFLTTVLLTVCVSASALAETARGTVFEDINLNGTLDDGEPRLQGIHVSNGRDIATTGENGGYRIDARDGDIIFVIKPTGYRTPMSAEMLPRFHYIHAPQGTPEALKLRYPGLAPTGPLPEAIDFPLVGQDESGPFEVIELAALQRPEEGVDA